MRVTSKEWDDFISRHPQAHVLQTSAWGVLKSGFGWKAIQIISDEDSGAQILFRQLPLGFSIGYVPKGPVGLNPCVLEDIEQVCREEHAIFVKIEPDAWEPETPSILVNDSYWKKSKSIQPQRTVLVNLNESEENILMQMKQKTRYNIRLAEKKEIKIVRSEDVEAFHRMSIVTASRDGFGVHALSYYKRAFELFHPTGGAELFLATYLDKPVAGIMVFLQGDMSWYMYGASTDEERNRMPAYLVQWEAMKWVKSRGCKYYDLWGIPDLDEEKLEEEFTQKQSHDGLWGVYRFKRGFGGEVYRSVGAWDYVFNPLMYKLYQLMMRIRGRQDE